MLRPVRIRLYLRFRRFASWNIAQNNQQKARGKYTQCTKAWAICTKWTFLFCAYCCPSVMDKKCKNVHRSETPLEGSVRPSVGILSLPMVLYSHTTKTGADGRRRAQTGADGRRRAHRWTGMVFVRRTFVHDSWTCPGNKYPRNKFFNLKIFNPKSSFSHSPKI